MFYCMDVPVWFIHLLVEGFLICFLFGVNDDEAAAYIVCT